jgi:hypothetical protein
MWDAPLSMPLEISQLLFLLVLGFSFLIGDLYVRDVESGTAAMTVLRSRSRTRWWLAKVLSLGVLALLFATVGFITVLAVSAVRLPVSWEPSTAAELSYGSAALYPRFAEWPMPVFFAFVVLYTALTLWAVGAVLLVVSVFFTRLIVPISVIILWVMVDGLLVPVYLPRNGLGLLDPLYHVSYAIHFGGSGTGLVSWYISGLLVVATLALVLLLGAAKVSRTDL